MKPNPVLHNFKCVCVRERERSHCKIVICLCVNTTVQMWSSAELIKTTQKKTCWFYLCFPPFVCVCVFPFLCTWSIIISPAARWDDDATIFSSAAWSFHRSLPDCAVRHYCFVLMAALPECTICRCSPESQPTTTLRSSGCHATYSHHFPMFQCIFFSSKRLAIGSELKF